MTAGGGCECAGDEERLLIPCVNSRNLQHKKQYLLAYLAFTPRERSRRAKKGCS